MSDAANKGPTDVPVDASECHLEHEAIGPVQVTIVDVASSAPAASIALTLGALFGVTCGSLDLITIQSCRLSNTST